MSIVECLKWQNFSQAQEEQTSTEGKAGVPRFDGEVTKLAEYQFRVRLRQSRERAMDEAELKKLGPLGLRLIDGLRGPALQVARGLQVDKLSRDEGPTYLLQSLQAAFQPRSKQEARDLYQVGAQQGGILSRQSGESIPSYVLRRRTWYAMMTDLDGELKLPEPILAEQILQNSGISSDHQLLIRTAIRGEMTVAAVCEELVAQHSRVHERENRSKGGFHNQFVFYKGRGNGKGKGDRRPWSRAYYTEDDGPGDWSESWDSHSQSLGGYEDYENAVYYGEEEAPMDDDEAIYEAYAVMVEQGLDEDNTEALEYAAEIIQAESEVFFVRNKAHQSGHYGFGGGRQFQVQGHLTLEERKARVQAMKSKTTCRRCGQVGHWSGDPQCPKGYKKGKGKSGHTTSSTSSMASTKGGGKSKGRGGGDKPRTVFFTINEYDKKEAHQEGSAYMMVPSSDEESDSDGDHRAMPPPNFHAVPPVVLQPGYGGSQAQPHQETADEALDRKIREMRAQQQVQGLSSGPLPLEHRSEQEEKQKAQARQAHLDLFLQTVNDPNDAEWRDAYNERWNEFVPGHPDFLEEDRRNLERWRVKAALGLPRIPTQQPTSQFQLQSTEPTQHPMTLSCTTATLSTTTTPAGSGVPTGQGTVPDPLASAGRCNHDRTTKHGSNAYYDVLKCRDCVKTDVDGNCTHEEKDFRGTTATTWRWKCKRCGHQEKGSKKPAETGQEASRRTSTGTPTTSSMPSPSADAVNAEQVMQLFNNTIQLQKELGVQVGLKELDKIYSKCRAMVEPTSGTTTTTGEASSNLPRTTPDAWMPFTEDEVSVHHLASMKQGVHKGIPFKTLFEKEVTYTASMLKKFQNGHLKDPDLILYCRYVAGRKIQQSVSYMSLQDDQQDEIDYEDDEVYAIIDTGCNNTCHGSRWMEKYQRVMGEELHLSEAEGKFRGVGGRVQVAGKRVLPIKMTTTSGQEMPGTITSIELEDSDAPLLLSAQALGVLGLVIDLADYTAYSKTLDQEIEIVRLNGLPAIRLRKGEVRVDNIALMSQADSTPGEEEEEDLGESKEVPEDQALPETTFEEDDFNYQENYIPLTEGKIKTLSKGQKKHLQETLDDVQKEDTAMWSTLKGQSLRPRRMLPRGCKTFLMEVFAGAATLSVVASQLGLPISAPVDIEYDPRFNLLNKNNREALWKQIEEDDPFLLSLAPVCGPWSPWQHVNLQRSESAYEKVMEHRKLWYPVVQWVASLIEHRLQRGREVLVENPWGSMMWQLRCMDHLISKAPCNSITGEALELQRTDQCMYGLKDETTGRAHEKATGLLLSSASMKQALDRRCDGQHVHEHLAGGKTKKAQQWPEDLCRQMIAGALDEMRLQVINFAFPAELELEDHEASGSLDAITSAQDIAESPMKRRKIDLNELDTEEDFEQGSRVEDALLHQKELDRRKNWLKLDRSKRVAIRRLHNMMGHCSTQALVRMLTSAMAGKDVIEAAHHFRCQACDEVRLNDAPRVVKPMKENQNMKFNYEISADVFEIHDSMGQRHSILSLLDLATHYHVAVRVCSGGTPSSRSCAEAINTAWLSWAGPPKYFCCDQGVHNSGRVAALLEASGTEIRKTGARAPFQLGTGERHGGLLKETMKKAIHDRQLHGADTIAALCSESCRCKNVLVNHGGYSPAQWVLGYTPEDVTSLSSNDPDERLGTHQLLVDMEDEKTPQEQFMMQLLIRQFAKEAFMKIDSSQRIRKALLRKSVPMRGPYRPGDLVCFSKKGKWYGPARVLSNEGKSSLWLVHGGMTILVAETGCRPASAQEVLRKQILELRPARKRKRDILSEYEEGDDYVPFMDDGEEARSLRMRTETQAPFLDIAVEEPQQPLQPPGAVSLLREEGAEETADDPPSGVATIPEVGTTEPRLDEVPAQLQLTDLAMEPPPGFENVMVSTSSLTSSQSGQQPENEASPEFSPLTTEEAVVPATSDSSSQLPPGPPPATELTQALRNNPSGLDGLPRGYHVKTEGYKEDKCWAFLASRQSKKVVKKYKPARTQKKGAGRELVYGRESEQVRGQLDQTREKEWSNWKKYTDGVWIDRSEYEKMKNDDPSLRIIPTRWVDVNKAEEGEADQFKSRLVVRGDLEDASKLRTDSPTCSTTLLSLVLSLAACRDTDLWTGDISAAFLQGSKLDRTLILSMPKEHPEMNSAEKLYKVSSTVYGTKDAPRGWFKNLNRSMLEIGFRPVPHEAAAYVLNNPDGSLAGLAIVHVDDLLWTGGSCIEDKMKAICEKYKFGKLEKNEFKYCGRNIVKNLNGIYVTCPNLADRIRPIHLTAEQRKQKKEKVNEDVKNQLRSIIGSLAWLSRVCRPDLAYAVSKMQADVHQACYEDVAFANGIVNIARKTKNRGLCYPIKPFDFDNVMIVGIQDASFGNDAEVSKSGNKLGLRSQSGRLLCLADRSFKETQRGVLLPIEWHSTTIKRVCKSTLQAETMSLLSGSEEADHLRMVMHGLFHEHDYKERQKWVIASMDEIEVDFYTDCRSLEEHVCQPGLHTVTDKRLAIDLSGIRQQVWRQQGEEFGDPLLTDWLPSGGTTRLLWTSTDRMVVDCMTKAMKPGSLCTVMDGAETCLVPTKTKECENEGS